MEVKLLADTGKGCGGFGHKRVSIGLNVSEADWERENTVEL